MIKTTTPAAHLRPASAASGESGTSWKKKHARFEAFSLSALVFSALLAVIGCITFGLQANRILDGHDSHRRAAEASAAALNILSNIQNMETGQQHYMLTGDVSFMAPFEQGRLELRKNIALLDRMVPEDDGAAKALIAKLRMLAHSRLPGTSGSMTPAVPNGVPQTITTQDLADDSARLRALQHIVQELNAGFRQRQLAQDKVTDEVVRDAKGLFGLWVLSIAAGFCLAFWYGAEGRRLLRREAQRLAMDASHDQLTGLPNRRFLTEWTKNAMADSVRRREPLAALFIDLDGFSDINNTLGHDAGDTALVWASQTIRSQIRSTDCLSRLGGDEFVVIACGLAPAQLETLAQRLLQAFANGRPISHLPLGALGLSIGIAQLSLDKPDIERLLADADQAMYEAKRAGKRCYRVAGDVGPILRKAAA
ncbi:GGDEF domain-containing protein [Noviherbaspirillum malthae]|uniref:GGDEF domain-containing protein n=1 Tax=Noviherbaspirillum malthae TaxID=1260987 RepID=UPI00188F584E|nr:diguanylate cyclase [Noviherbaspirillum malthae]